MVRRKRGGQVDPADLADRVGPPRLAGPGRFVTRAVFDHPDGSHTVVGSRQYRKGIPPHRAPAARDHVVPRSRASAFAAVRLATASEWIALLFMAGSSCFAAAGFQAAFPDAGIPLLRSAAAQNVTFFVGSIFFTAAAGMQWVQSIRADLGRCTGRTPGPRWLDWRPRDCGYMACATQFVGTVLFNLNTGDPLIFGGGWVEQDVAVWVPNAGGSALFLASSIYACIEAGQRFWAFEPKNFSWWIAEINLAGSVLFGVSAALSIALPGGLPEAVSAAASLCTGAGGVCFFVAAALMLPEQADEPTHPEAVPQAG